MLTHTRDIDRGTWWVAALFVVLALTATYPIATAPNAYAYFDHPDAQLNMWIMAWDAHALGHDPANLFNANIFYPEARTLAYSETLLGYLPLFGPILWLHGSPVLAFNTVLLFSFAASGFAMYLFARQLTGREWPSIVAGIAYAFTPYRFVHVPQIQLEAMEWIPLSFLCLQLFLERGYRRYAAGLGVCVVLQALCCIYYALFLAIGLAVYWMCMVPLDASARDGRRLLALALMACAAGVLLAPVLSEYWVVHRARGFERGLTEITTRSADAGSYLASAAPLHLALGSRFETNPHDYLFPGLAVLLLAATGLVAARRRILVPLLAVGLIAVAASFGPNGFLGLPVYRILYVAIPLFHGLRQVSRFGVLALFAISALAAFGSAALEKWIPDRRRLMGMILIAAVVFLELLAAPLRYDRPDGVELTRIGSPPDEYRWLASQPDSRAVVELPFGPSHLVWRNAPYVFWSTIHWHPLINGYSGFTPNSYHQFERMLRLFPDRSLRQALLALNVRYVIIHWRAFHSFDTPVDAEQVRNAEWLRPVARFDTGDVFEIR